MQPGQRHPWKKVGQFILRNFLSVIAIIVSILVYVDQHNANVDQHNVNEAAANSAQQTYAAQVSFWLVSVNDSSIPQLIIQNRSFAPISNVFLQLSASGWGGWLQINTSAGSGTIPPCSIDTTLALKDAAGAAFPRNLTWSVALLRFTDASGITWARLPDGTLVKYPGNIPNDSQALNTPIVPGNNISPANGCS